MGIVATDGLGRARARRRSADGVGDVQGLRRPDSRRGSVHADPAGGEAQRRVAIKGQRSKVKGQRSKVKGQRAKAHVRGQFDGFQSLPFAAFFVPSIMTTLV